MHEVVSSNAKKIAVAKPVVELDGDEMTRVIWNDIKEKVRGSCENSVVLFDDGVVVHSPIFRSRH